MSKDEFLSVGGQAIVEGVMMRSPSHFSVACRAPNKEIIVRTEPIEKTWIGRQKWLKIPFLRGSWALLDAMTLGTRAMKFASNVQLAPEFQPKAQEQEPVAASEMKIQDIAVFGALFIGLAIAIVLFKFGPQVLGTYLRTKLGWSDLKTNLSIEGIHAVVFIGYLYLIRMMPAILEVFRYHGAEHKAINAYEAEKEITVQNAAAQSRFHPRCGTSFAVIVLILQFPVFGLLPRIKPSSATLEALANFGLHLLILPIIAGIAYELLRFAGKYRHLAWVNAMFAPGLWTQRITTEEPEEHHLEVAVASLNACLKPPEKN